MPSLNKTTDSQAITSAVNPSGPTTAFLFPGQGAQYVGMGRSWYEGDSSTRHLFDSTPCDFDLKGLCFNGQAETLRDTRYSQASIFMVSVSIASWLTTHGIRPDVMAGLSLGEYSALCCADCFSPAAGVRMLSDRGRIMADLIPQDSGMMAILGLDSETILECCAQSQSIGACEIANYNTARNIVITGNLEAVKHCGTLCLARGAKMVAPLDTSGAFHSELAHPAAVEFEATLQSYEIKQPSMPIYYNRDGTRHCADIKSMEVDQLYLSVRFSQIIDNMLRDGVTRFIAIGPGVALAGYVREIARAYGQTIENYTVDSFEDGKALVNKLGVRL